MGGHVRNLRPTAAPTLSANLENDGFGMSEEKDESTMTEEQADRRRPPRRRCRRDRRRAAAGHRDPGHARAPGGRSSSGPRARDPAHAAAGRAGSHRRRPRRHAQVRTAHQPSHETTAGASIWTDSNIDLSPGHWSISLHLTWPQTHGCGCTRRSARESWRARRWRCSTAVCAAVSIWRLLCRWPCATGYTATPERLSRPGFSRTSHEYERREYASVRAAQFRWYQSPWFCDRWWRATC